MKEIRNYWNIKSAQIKECKYKYKIFIVQLINFEFKKIEKRYEGSEKMTEHIYIQKLNSFKEWSNYSAYYYTKEDTEFSDQLYKEMSLSIIEHIKKEIYKKLLDLLKNTNYIFREEKLKRILK
jgi:hypothetical protein